MNCIKRNLWALIGLLVVVLIIGGCGSSSKKSSNTSHEYMAVSIATLESDLENNAAAAQKKYKGKYVKVTGVLGNIDSDGDYISLNDPNNAWSFMSFQCFVNQNDKNQTNFVLNLRKGQQVTAYGKITDVGEVLGYSMDVDKFE